MPNKNFETKIMLYGIPVSTSCARIRIVLDHKQIPYTELPPPDGYATKAYRKLIPSGTVPGLIIEGLCDAPFALSDSNAQSVMLDELFDRIPMMLPIRPDTLLNRAKINSLSSFHDVRLEPSVRSLFPLVAPDQDRDEDAISKATGLFQNRLNLLEAMISPDPFLGGDMFTHVDAAFPTTVYMGLDIAAELGAPCQAGNKIKRWIAELEKIPAVAKSLSPNRQSVRAWMNSKTETTNA